MIELKRTKYLTVIEPFIHDGGIIKVLSGIRRCGKSTIMKQIADDARNYGDVSIVYLDLDEDIYENVTTPELLRSVIEESFSGGEKKKYLFIDEVQNVEGFETVVESYRKKDVSVFITGSNSYLLSSELTTKLTGRYIEFRILPFSFSEVEEYRRQNNITIDVQSDFTDYLIYGGMPKRFDYPAVSSQERYVFAILEEIIKKDILKRGNVRNRELLERLIAFISSIPSQEISIDSITDFVSKQDSPTKKDTVRKYLNEIFSSNIASKCMMYDIMGKKVLKIHYKSYLADLALHTFVSGKKDKLDYDILIENVVYNELISRGYSVLVGRKGKAEIDFVVSDGMRKAYVQVAYLMPDSKVVKHEEEPLLAMRDGFPKYIISMDPLALGINGIRRLNLVNDFLLGDGFVL